MNNKKYNKITNKLFRLHPYFQVIYEVVFLYSLEDTIEVKLRTMPQFHSLGASISFISETLEEHHYPSVGVPYTGMDSPSAGSPVRPLTLWEQATIVMPD